MKTYIQRTVSETVMATPDDFFGKLNRIFRFTIDVCALPINAKCESYFTPEMDGLSQDWVGGGMVQSPLWDRNRGLVPKGFGGVYEGLL